MGNMSCKSGSRVKSEAQLDKGSKHLGNSNSSEKKFEKRWSLGPQPAAGSPLVDAQGLQMHHSKVLSKDQVKQLEGTMQDVGRNGPDDTIGVVRFVLLRAELKPEVSYKVHATVSVGLQSFLSKDLSSSTPTFNQGHNFVLQQSGGGHTAQISIFQKKAKGKKPSLLCYTTVDLLSFFKEGSAAMEQAVDQELSLQDPINHSQTVGKVWIRVEAATINRLEETLWERLLKLVDINGDGMLQRSEFKVLMSIIGNDIPDSDLDTMYGKADIDMDGGVSAEELAKYITEVRQEVGLRFLKQCPVTGTDLTSVQDRKAVVFVHLAMDKGTGESLQGGYKTAEEANRTWMYRLSEWVTHPVGGTLDSFYKGNKYEAGGLNVGRGAAHILVWDREKAIVFEEIISPHLVLAMRNIYQSRFGKGMLATGAPQAALKELTEHKGKYMDSPESVKDIQPFLESFRGRINMDEAAEPAGGFKTFNEFFFRKLKAGTRPIASKDDPSVAVHAADCRLMVFDSVDSATRLWIKGKNFSIRGLLADTEGKVAAKYEKGSLAVFRLAPQDYHRFHFPVSGTLRSSWPISGEYYTVNPIAINSAVDVFTENKRTVCIIDSPEFGEVAVVCIGATMVASIVLTGQVGKTYNKGDELGYFAFGGSTVIALFSQGAIELDADLLEHSGRSLETLVKMGTQLGKSRR